MTIFSRYTAPKAYICADHSMNTPRTRWDILFRKMWTIVSIISWKHYDLEIPYSWQSINSTWINQAPPVTDCSPRARYHRQLVKPGASPVPATGAPINSMIPSANIAKGMGELQTVLRCDKSLPQPLAIKSGWCPLLQDIDGDIAHILSLSEGQSSEVTMTKLSNASSYADLREAQSVAFMCAIGIVLDSDDTDTIELP